MKPVIRRAVLASTLVATVVAAYLAPSDTSQADLLAPRPAQMKPDRANGGAAVETPTPEVGETRVLALFPRLTPTEPVPVFGATPPPSAALAPASAPTSSSPPVFYGPPPPDPIPQLTLQILGRFADGADRRIFVRLNGRDVVLRVGDTIDGLFKVEEITDTQLSARHLPTKKVQFVSLALVGR